MGQDLDSTAGGATSYGDHTVTIDGDGITIRAYTFPLARPKRLAFSDIESVAIKPTTGWSRWRLWGSSNFRDWFPLDRSRTKAEHFVEFDVGGRVRPSITPREPETVAEIVRDALDRGNMET